MDYFYSMSLSIAIPTMKRWAFLKDVLPIYIARPEVIEIVICDETGEDIDAILRSPLSLSSKLRLHKNKKILGIYENKCQALRLCLMDWVALLDSDNIFNDDWFDSIKNLSYTDPKIIYASADFKSIDIRSGEIVRPAEAFSGMKISDAQSWNAALDMPKWNFILNDGNWLLHKDAANVLPNSIASSKVLASDAIFMLRCFIKNGYSIHYVPELEYIHTVHSESEWIKTAKKSSEVLMTTDWSL